MKKYLLVLAVLIIGCQKDAPPPTAATFQMVSIPEPVEFHTGTRQTILPFTAVSTGPQQLKSLTFTFSVDVSSALSNFTLSNGKTTLARGSFDPSYRTLTFLVSDTLTTTPRNYILTADVNVGAPIEVVTASLSNSGVVTMSGLVNKFSFSNWMDLLPAGVTITGSRIHKDLSYGTTSNVLMSFYASTSGHQHLTSVNFVFSPNASSLFSNFKLTDGNNTLGKASAYDAVTNSITIYDFDEALSSEPKQYYLTCDVNSVVLPFTGAINLNPEQIGVSYGIVRGFATLSTDFTVIAPLLTSMYAFGGGPIFVDLWPGYVSNALIFVAAYSTGTQNMDTITFQFSKDISTLLTNFKLSGPTNSGKMTYNATTFALTFSGMTSPIKTESTGFVLYADVLSTAATTNLTISVLPKDVYVSPGGVYPFPGVGMFLYVK